MAASLRVVFVTTGLQTGGAEVFLGTLTKELVRRGVACSVISLAGWGPEADRIAAGGCEIVAPKLGYRTALAMHLARCRHEILSRRPSVVQGWMYHGNIAATLATVGTDIPVAWSIHHSVDALASESRALRLLIRLSQLVSHRPSAIHYCAQSSADQHDRLGFSSATRIVIPNGFDCELFKPAPERRDAARRAMGLLLAENAVVLGSIGRFHPMKNHRGFLEAAAIVASTHRNVSFVMMGQGVSDENQALVSVRRSLNLEDRVTFLGPRRDVAALMHGLDILSTSSAWGESFPIVLGEAMAAGIPCVATDVGDCRLLVGDTGAIVPPNDAEALASAWLSLISESGEQRIRRGLEARKRILDKFEISKVGERFQDRYATLASNAAIRRG